MEAGCQGTVESSARRRADSRNRAAPRRLRWRASTLRLLAAFVAVLFAGTFAQGAVAGALDGSTATPPSAVDLTTEGAADWIHWGRTSRNTKVDRKAGAEPQIGNWAPVGAADPTPSTGALAVYAWTDGTPLASTTGSKRGLRLSEAGQGLAFTAPADTTERILRVYVGAKGVKARLVATLSDGSAPPSSTLIDAPSSKLGRVVTLAYRANSAGQTLQVSYTLESQYPVTTRWVTLESATLQVVIPPPPPPPPATDLNVIPNASMEENTKWVFPALGGYSASQANTGARSIYLVNNGSATATSGSYQATQTRIPNVVPGQEYVANVWVKGQDVVGKDNFGGNAPLLVLRFRNAAGSYMDFVDSAGKKHVMEGYNWAPLGTYNWNKRTLHLQAPANAAMLDVSFRSWFWCISGTTFWDDASFAPRVVAGRGALLATYQAETANTRSGGVLAVDEPDFTGTGYFDVTTNNAVLEWTNVQGGGSRVIAMRYAWEGGGRPVELLVNGVSQSRKTPVMTGRRGFWATENWTVNLPNATNTVRLVIGKASGTQKIQPQVDRLEVYATQ